MITKWNLFSSIGAFQDCFRNLGLNMSSARNLGELILVLNMWLIEARVGIRWPEDYVETGSGCDCEEYRGWLEGRSVRAKGEKQE
jgi:hypothetical protein